MCGIFCCIHCSKHGETPNFESDEWKMCKERVSSRGPDNLFEKSIKLSDTYYSHFAASVLWTQGSKLIAQPCIDADDNILLWNGDIFSENVTESSESDTSFILQAFKTSNVISTLQNIKGPYSFVYFQKCSNLLYFGRDFLGRHSLLINFNHVNNILSLTSVTSRKFEGTIELPAIGVFVLKLSDSNSLGLNLTCFPWKKPNELFYESLKRIETLFNSDIKVEKVIFSQKEEFFDPAFVNLRYFYTDTLNSRNFENIMESLLERTTIRERVENLEHLLNASVKVRIEKQPFFCKNCIKLVLKEDKTECFHTKVGILFSGGLDSSILAAIADKFVPEGESIDLINVAFEKANSKNQNREEMYNVPDRKTGKQSYSDLASICPKRNWNFIEVNISQEELNTYRASRISDLVYPLGTILDESLGCALWFASRGIGFSKGKPYESPCRILLLGMGADELFGGYMRHRTILKHKGWEALTEQLHLELNRISERNLGRDDRVTSDHGKQARYPYLDENLVEYVQSLPPWERCCPTDEMPCGFGDKLLLRLVAMKLNLKNAANFPKRAFQFGSRIANGRENAKDLSNRL